ncbi:Chaperone required for the assembly of the F1-ATPase [Palleronia marisminoris]|uniref:ATP12 chaperone protein n=1 Tax=Palleronia marisminoris TaxID=315423 RepID=A0A1Y5T4E8_9RHOB|nr:ATP12 family protein [Palleronia marisminoris]SFH16602.1 Chaperone required for the assembly of the F1-ATPase [Palleronia marisminoris]SLN55562.1 ATP12 chaperone protein [Palleronia marisminoris]
MSDWAPKRFWKSAQTEPVEGGIRVLLDDKPIRTPAGESLVLPTEALAEAVAAEWDAQAKIVDPGSMPMTRTANSAIDKVAPQKAAVVAALAEYGGTDLLSYRAENPQALVLQQSQMWDPLLDWAEETFGARLVTTQGVMPVAQDAAALDRLVAPMHEMSKFRLAAFHDLVALSGSLVLAHAAAWGARSPVEVWDLSRLDEEWQAEEWGRDEEAEDFAARKRRAFLDAHRFWALAT